MAKVPELLSRFKLNYSLLSLVLASIIMLEGAAIAVMARRIDLIENWGTGLFQSTVALVGLQLLAIGLLAIACLIINGEMLSQLGAVRKVRSVLFRDRHWLSRVFSLIPIIMGAIVAIEGLVVAYYASPMVVSGLGNVRGMWMAAFGAQLFLLGSALAVSRIIDGKLDMPMTIRSGILLLFASFGVLIYGLADRAEITGIGGMREGTVELLGIQMSVIALLGIALLCLGNRFFLGRKLLGWKIGTLGVILLSIVLCFEGLVIASAAAPFRIDSIGGMLERTMLLAGVGLAVLAMVVPASFYFMEKKDKDIRKLAYAATLFLFFMLPFAVLM